MLLAARPALTRLGVPIETVCVTGDRCDSNFRVSSHARIGENLILLSHLSPVTVSAIDVQHLSARCGRTALRGAGPVSASASARPALRLSARPAVRAGPVDAAEHHHDRPAQNDKEC